MVSGYVPPPPQTVPAEIQTIDANHNQGLYSPLQTEINNFNPDGPAPTLKYEQPEQSQPDNGKREQDLNKSVEGIAEGVAGAKDAKDKAEENEEQSNAIKGPVYADYTDPPASEQKAAPAQEANTPSESAGESVDSAPNTNNEPDYYNGIGY